MRSKRIQFTVATKDDHTNWRKAKIKVKFLPNMYLKYPDEYLRAINNLILILKFLIKLSKFCLYFELFGAFNKNKIWKIRKIF